jgi:hypothetical protein
MINLTTKDKQGSGKLKKASESKLHKILDTDSASNSNSEVPPVDEKLQKTHENESVNDFEEKKKESPVEEPEAKVFSSPRQEEEEESI